MQIRHCRDNIVKVVDGAGAKGPRTTSLLAQSRGRNLEQAEAHVGLFGPHPPAIEGELDAMVRVGRGRRERNLAIPELGVVLRATRRL
jgi:hypothetical protein